MATAADGLGNRSSGHQTEQTERTIIGLQVNTRVGAKLHGSSSVILNNAVVHTHVVLTWAELTRVEVKRFCTQRRLSSATAAARTTQRAPATLPVKLLPEPTNEKGLTAALVVCTLFWIKLLSPAISITMGPSAAKLLRTVLPLKGECQLCRGC